MSHQFSSPLARDLFSLATETMQGALRGANQNVPPFEPDAEWDKWADARESERPVYLKNADPRDVAIELERLTKPSFKGLPHE